MILQKPYAKHCTLHARVIASYMAHFKKKKPCATTSQKINIFRQCAISHPIAHGFASTMCVVILLHTVFPKAM
jgi:hypothetical protein